MDVAKGNSNFVVISVDNKVFLSTNALQQDAGVPFGGVIFTEITRDLPSRFVNRLAFDRNDPSTIYAVLAGFGIGHVFGLV